MKKRLIGTLHCTNHIIGVYVARTDTTNTLLYRLLCGDQSYNLARVGELDAGDLVIALSSIYFDEACTPYVMIASNTMCGWVLYNQLTDANVERWRMPRRHK